MIQSNISVILKFVLSCNGLFIILLFTSCSRQNYVYRAPMIQANVFEAKGDVYASFGVNQLAGLSVGYAITDQLGVLVGIHGERLGDPATYQHYNDTGLFLGEAVVQRARNGFEVGAVYFRPFATSWQLEVTAGMGIFDQKTSVERSGNLVGSPYDFDEHIDRMYNRIFLQPSVSFEVSNWRLGVGMRTQSINYTSLTPPFGDLLLEPFFQVKGGHKAVGASFVAGPMFSSQNGIARYYPIHLGLSISLSLGTGRN